MCVQEEITQGVVSLSVETGKMTADLLQKAVKKVLEEMQKKPSQRTLRQGKQTLHQLKQHAELWETMFAGCGKAGGFSIGP